MLFLGMHKVDHGVCARCMCVQSFRKRASGMIRPSKLVCCAFRFLILMLPCQTFRLFNRFSAFIAYITPPH